MTEARASKEPPSLLDFVIRDDPYALGARDGRELYYRRKELLEEEIQDKIIRENR